MLLIVGCIVFGVASYAHAINISFINKNIWLSKEQNLVMDDKVTIYSMIVNNEDKNIGGDIKFIDTKTNQQVGGIVAFSLPGQGTSQVLSTQWKATPGDHIFKAQIINAYEIVDGARKIAEISLSSSTTDSIFVDHDADGDGLLGLIEKEKGTDPNNPDTDGDTLKDGEDPDPLKKDADGDGDPDNTDPEPLNPKVKTLPDTDNDGKPDPEDSDDDNDGLYDWEEEGKSDPLKYDTDGDGVGDKDDAYPRDPNRSELEVAVEKKEDASTDSNVNVEVKEESSKPEQNNNEDISIDKSFVEELDNFLNSSELGSENENTKSANGLEVLENDSMDMQENLGEDIHGEEGHPIKFVGFLILFIGIIIGTGLVLAKKRA